MLESSGVNHVAAATPCHKYITSFVVIFQIASDPRPVGANSRDDVILISGHIMSLFERFISRIRGDFAEDGADSSAG